MGRGGLPKYGRAGLAVEPGRSPLVWHGVSLEEDEQGNLELTYWAEETACGQLAEHGREGAEPAATRQRVTWELRSAK